MRPAPQEEVTDDSDTAVVEVPTPRSGLVWSAVLDRVLKPCLDILSSGNSCASATLFQPTRQETKGESLEELSNIPGRNQAWHTKGVAEKKMPTFITLD